MRSSWLVPTLSSFFGGYDPGYPVVDALEIHVEAMAEMAAAEMK